MQRIVWLKYKEKKILFADYSGLTTPELLELFETFNKIVLQLNEKILFMADFSKTAVDKTVIQQLKTAESKMVAAKFNKAAVFGITGLKRTILNFYNAATGGNVKAFPDKKAALEWLVAPGEKSQKHDASFLNQ
jgi:hypothetical protein